MEAHMQMQIPLFNGEDHEIWSIKIKTLLMARDLWDVVETGVSEENTSQHMGKLAVERQKDERIKDMTALHMLQMSVTDSIFLRIGRATSSKQAWEILKAEFGETNEIRISKLSYLATKLDQMMMKNEESVWDYIQKVIELVNQFNFYGYKISDDEVIRKILRSLPSRFDEMVNILRGERLALTRVAYILRETELSQCVNEASVKKLRKREEDVRELYQLISHLKKNKIKN